MNRKIIGVIPARGGSKGIYKKNLVDINGKPMLYYTIKSSINSNLDRIILSSEDKDIIKVGKEYGLEVPFIRPKNLSEDNSHTQDVILHALKWLEENENYKVHSVMTLQPTSPLRKTNHINEAINKFIKEGTNSLISINKKTSKPPWWLLKKNKNGLIDLFFKDYEYPFNLERQQFPELYSPDGSIFITKRDFLFKNKSLFDFDNCSYYEIDEKYSIDVDNYVDLEMVKILMKNE